MSIFSTVHDHIKDVIGTIAPVDSVERYEGLGVTVLGGEARFTGPQTIQVGNTTVKARRVVIATGSRPAVPPIPGLDTVPYLTNEVKLIFDRKELPEHLIIVGGGPIGLELAQAHNRLGAKVTVLEGFKILGREDREAADLVKATLQREGVAIHEQAMVSKVAKDGEGVEVTIEIGEGETKDAQTVKGSHIMIAAGRSVNIEGLDLDKAGIAHDRRGITVDAGMRTTNKQGLRHWRRCRRAAIHPCGRLSWRAHRPEHPLPAARSSQNARPSCRGTTYTDPEVASVGATAGGGGGHARPARVLRWSFHENDRAIAERTTEGFIKVFHRQAGQDPRRGRRRAKGRRNHRPVGPGAGQGHEGLRYHRLGGGLSDALGGRSAGRRWNIIAGATENPVAAQGNRRLAAVRIDCRSLRTSDSVDPRPPGST
jgi:pyruvate/2-oxoglutarate dehydrogenase complex dihydrolipoamide dehydrogenase (E3) component